MRDTVYLLALKCVLGCFGPGFVLKKKKKDCQNLSIFETKVLTLKSKIAVLHRKNCFSN